MQQIPAGEIKVGFRFAWGGVEFTAIRNAELCGGGYFALIAVRCKDRKKKEQLSDIYIPVARVLQCELAEV